MMVTMKLISCSSTNVEPQAINAKLRFLGSADNHRKHLLKLPCSVPQPPSLLIFNSQQRQLFPPVDQSVAAIVFGDGSDSESRRRLYPLTKRRTEGAIPMAANYRLIDAVVSNCINSNINKIYALTQFNSTSLNLHLSRAYSGLFRGKQGFVEVIAAYQSLEHQGWFQGNADAIRRCLWVLEEYPVAEFLVLPGHHLYRMDYQKLIEAHRNSKADVTIVALSGTRDPVNSITVYDNVSSTGIYVINRDTMSKLVNEYFPEANDFASELIPGAISIGLKIESYLFDGYWEDMRSIHAFYQANMECIKKSNMSYNFYDRESPLYTMPRCLPPSLVSDAVISDSVIADGCILNKCKIKRTIVGMRTRIEDGAVIEDSVIMGSDIYQQKEDDVQNIPIGIGENTQIRKAIIDKNARIGKNVKIINKDNVQEGDREANGYIVSGGIVVLLRGAQIADGTIL
ncbi:hypothetical protein Dsin_018842 [Dipteronia sinensis]|uniref:Nucleotidyl transferase domain-containing protein n=1 Tax=Dipteronia sinensis TaxID=43782 RepID=A0AAE0A7K0_9ROSI|nr:hypothetical protein Dsin_018842 [Dipteronia sinensis]